MLREPHGLLVRRVSEIFIFLFLPPCGVGNRGSTTSFSIGARITIGKVTARARHWLARETGDL